MITFHHRGFEQAVRESTNIYNRPIEEADLLQIEALDCSTFYFVEDDLEILRKCTGLRRLNIDVDWDDLSFLSDLLLLEYLDLVCRTRSLDFWAFSCLQSLEYLLVSGGDYSSIPFLHTEALPALKKLTSLEFHEFGTVDLRFLEDMPWLEEFRCGWPIKVTNISSIGKLINLQVLSLYDMQMENLDFLDDLPDTLSLTLCGNDVKNRINPEKLRRFQEVDVSEMSVGGKDAGILIEPN